MDTMIYTGPQDHMTIVTAMSPQSHYGIPDLRIDRPGFEYQPDYGPAEVLKSAVLAAEFIRIWAEGITPDDDAWRFEVSEAGGKAARAFCG